MALAAPMISSYCVASVLWSRLFLKEKLSKAHYACIFLVIAGIVIMGITEGMEEAADAVSEAARFFDRLSA